MRLRPTALALLASASAIAIAACGDGEGSGRSFDDKAPNQTHVALFVNDTFVEFDTTTSEAEGSNMLKSLVARGFLVDTFSTTDPAEVAAILGDADVLILPEPEIDSYSGLPAGTMAAIKSFVQDGGTLAWFDYADEMNPIFGWELDYGDDTSYAATILKNGSLAPFTGPDSLPWADATDIIESSTLPAGSTMPYKAGTDGAVVVIPVGKGEVVFFGFDWYDAAPFGTQDGGWIGLLDGLAKF